MQLEQVRLEAQVMHIRILYKGGLFDTPNRYPWALIVVLLRIVSPLKILWTLLKNVSCLFKEKSLKIS